MSKTKKLAVPSGRDGPLSFEIRDLTPTAAALR
jgi:hypothetical protein